MIKLDRQVESIFPRTQEIRCEDGIDLLNEQFEREREWEDILDNEDGYDDVEEQS